jgi:hypothetical protein
MVGNSDQAGILSKRLNLMQSRQALLQTLLIRLSTLRQTITDAKHWHGKYAAHRRRTQSENRGGRGSVSGQGERRTR